MADILDLNRNDYKLCFKASENDLVPRIENNLSYSEFFENYLLCNRPCIIKNLSDDWGARKWIKNDNLDVDYFRKNYGTVEVPIADCRKKVYNVQEKCSMKLDKYLDYWGKYQSNETEECLYLKDWHFTKTFPSENIYRTPKYFASDWLNEYFSSDSDDYRFVYVGPKGSWTPFHADVFTSYSWSVNICGEKKWLIFPPGEENKFKDDFGNLKYDFEDCGGLEKYLVIQKAGEGIFVPSGWHHQVWNLENTISINHNWVNGCNIEFMWNSLKKNLESVQKEINDCKDMENWAEQCQIVLLASYGFDYFKFYTLLYKIAQSRIRALKNSEFLEVYGNWRIGTNHMLWDLKRIESVLKILVNDEDFLNLDDVLKTKDAVEEPLEFLDNLQVFLSAS